MPRVVGPAVGAPLCVRGLVGQAVRILRTRGDGACAIHAVYGQERGGELQMPSPRKFLRDAFGSTAAEFRRRVNDTVIVDELAGVLWKELLKPSVCRASRGRGSVVHEGEAVWQRVWASNSELGRQLVGSFETGEAAYQVFSQKRDVIVDRFVDVCKRGEFRPLLVEPLLVTLDLQDEFNQPYDSVPGSTKLEVLFTDRFEARLLYKSIVECLGVDNFDQVVQIVNHVVSPWYGDAPAEGEPISKAMSSCLLCARCWPGGNMTSRSLALARSKAGQESSN